jgi:hypothetical protein
MTSLKRQNHIPEEAECLALQKVIAQEEAVIDTIRRVQREHEAEHQLQAEKAIILQRTLDSTKTLREVASQLCTHFIPLLAQLETQLAVQENDKTILATHLSSTPIFIDGWGVLKDGIIALHASLKQQLDRTQERITSITQELYSAESLRDQISSTISSFSSMIDRAQESIKSKKEGTLHPIRRLPVEILLHIFEGCVNDEINEYHHDLPKYLGVSPRIFGVPSTMALCLAGVCSRWRDIMLGAPYLWRHLRAPTPSLWGGSGAGSHFQNYLDRCRGSEIELTIPNGDELPDDLSPDTITIQRLNVELDAYTDELPILPSPVHLWLYHPEPLSQPVAPADLISRTTRLTVWNVDISFKENCQSITHLEICGVQPTFGFTQMISQLPSLTDVDLIRAEMVDAPILVLVPFTHFHLRYLGLSHGWIDFLERALRSGLRLPQLRHLELSGITSEYTETMYPHISAQLGATVVRLDFQGVGCSFDSIRSFIGGFRRVNTIGCYGRVAETVLKAFYEVRSSPVPVQTPGEVTIGWKHELVNAMPKGLEVVMIRDYEDDGRIIERQLRMMRQYPATDTQPITVVFENCLNILPCIRREFATHGPLIVV